MTRAIGLVALAACADLSAPPELGDDVITVTYDSGGIQVHGPLTARGEHLYEMTFPDPENEIPMPDSFKVGGRETLRLAPDDCNRERRIGVALFPAGVVTSGDVDAFAENDSNVETIVEAPGLAKVQVTYEIQYLCPALQTFRGESVFTFFPTGRIVREDIDLEPSDGEINPQGADFDCGCGYTDIDFFFTSFWAFLDNTVDEQVDADNVMPRDGETAAACTMYPTHGVGVAWPDASTRFHPSAASAHVYDFLANQNSIPADEVRSVTSAVQVHDGIRAQGTCGEILSQLVDPPLLVGEERLASSDHDGIYRPKTEHSDTTVLSTDEVIPGSWAISIDLGGADHGRVTRDPEIEDFYRSHADPETPGNTVFVFLQGLAPGESITIEPF